MRYKFEPLWFSFKKNKGFYFMFNVALQDTCNDSICLCIFLNITIVYQFKICLKPFGELFKVLK